MPSIFDYVTAKDIAAFVTNAPSNKIPYLGETLFPNKKQLGLDLKWIKGANGLPVALAPSNFDAKATLRERIGFNAVNTEMPFFRESMRVGEKDRQEINKLINGNNDAYLTPILSSIFDDVSKLSEGARVQAERMRMQLISTGLIAVSANRVNYNYDYKFNVDHKFIPTIAWTATTTADPIADITAAMDKIEEDTGVRPTQAVCSRATMNLLIANTKMRTDMFLTTGTVATLATVTENMTKKYISEKISLSIAVYNKKYALLGADGLSAGAYQYFPDKVFSLIPDGNLGNTYYGTTPEESDLMGGATDVDVQIVNTGIAITTIKEPHPVNVNTIVSGIFLPSFETIDQIAIMTISA